ncbi:hypothetical protein DIPPA_00420 [Diplonema papillatum]|nr:hypothetical protein DIPPA_00420 [Diplonema papillatum]
MLTAFVSRDNGPLTSLLLHRGGDDVILQHSQGGCDPYATQDGLDFECGGYRVTPTGKLLKRVRKTRVKERRSAAGSASEENVDPSPEIDLQDSDDDGMQDLGCAERHGVDASSEPSTATPLTKSHSELSGPRSAHKVHRPISNLNVSFKAALIVMPPVELWPAIQAIRSQYDPAYARWMPHINIAWPFATPAHHSQAAEALQVAFANVAPFEMHLNSLSSFPNNSSVVFLKPTASDGSAHHALVEIRKLVVETLPVCHSDIEFQPHLTVAKLSKAEVAAKKVQQLAWQPMSFTVSELYCISRPDDVTPFTITEVVPLGGSQF